MILSIYIKHRSQAKQIWTLTCTKFRLLVEIDIFRRLLILFLDFVNAREKSFAIFQASFCDLLLIALDLSMNTSRQFHVQIIAPHSFFHFPM